WTCCRGRSRARLHWLSRSRKMPKAPVGSACFPSSPNTIPSMLSLLKKKSDAAVAPQMPAWHPNFRNYAKLPDIKVVRTAFFINGVAITITLAAMIYLGIQEWQLRSINNQIADWQRQIDRDKKASDTAVALFKKFQSE